MCKEDCVLLVKYSDVEFRKLIYIFKRSGDSRRSDKFKIIRKSKYSEKKSCWIWTKINSQWTRLWFAKMRKCVKRHISSCAKCLIRKIFVEWQPQGLHQYPSPKTLFETVHPDHVGPLITTDSENTYMMALAETPSNLLHCIS